MKSVIEKGNIYLLFAVSGPQVEHFPEKQMAKFGELLRLSSALRVTAFEGPFSTVPEQGMLVVEATQFEQAISRLSTNDREQLAGRSVLLSSYAGRLAHILETLKPLGAVLTRDLSDWYQNPDGGGVFYCREEITQRMLPVPELTVPAMVLPPGYIAVATGFASLPEFVGKYLKAA